MKWLFGSAEDDDAAAGKALPEEGEEDGAAGAEDSEAPFDGGTVTPVTALRRTKICPRCGASTFSDMPICYGCLYEFDEADEELFGFDEGELPPSIYDDESAYAEDEERPLEVFPEAGEPGTAQHMVDGGDGDEDDCDDEEDGEAPAEDQVKVTGLRPLRDEHVPLVGGLHLSQPNRLGVEVRSNDLLLRCHVPRSGLTFGRDDDNDVVLSSPAVSRKHVRIVPTRAGLVVEDQGSTNLATIDGVPVARCAKLGFSHSLDICGTKVSAVCLSA